MTSLLQAILHPCFWRPSLLLKSTPQSIALLLLLGLPTVDTFLKISPRDRRHLNIMSFLSQRSTFAPNTQNPLLWHQQALSGCPDPYLLVKKLLFFPAHNVHSVNEWLSKWSNSIHLILIMEMKFNSKGWGYRVLLFSSHYSAPSIFPTTNGHHVYFFNKERIKNANVLSPLLSQAPRSRLEILILDQV